MARAGVPFALLRRSGLMVGLSGSRVFRPVRVALLLGLVALLPGGSFSLQARPVKVGVYSNPPKIFVNEAGEAAGFWPDLLRAIAKEEGLEIQWHFGDWDQNLKRLQSGEIHILPDVAVTEERQKAFLFGEETVHVSWSRVYAAPGVSISTIPDLQGLRIGALENSINLEGPEGLRLLLKRFAVQATIVPMSDYPSIFQALERGDIHAAITNRDFGNRMEKQYRIIRTPILFQPADLRFAFHKESSELRNAVDDAIGRFKRDSDSEYYRLQEKWLGVQDGEDRGLPLWLQWMLPGLLLLVLLLLGGLVLVEMRVRNRTRQIQKQQRTLENQDRILREANESLQTILEWRRAIINSLPAQIALLDANGIILEVNEQWENHQSREGYSGRAYPPGSNYPESCTRIRGEAYRESLNIVTGLKNVLSGASAEFNTEYSDHTTGGLRWYRMTANSIGTEKERKFGAVVMHLDITDRKMAELELNRLAFQDPVTGLASRIGFTRSLHRRIGRGGWKPSAILIVLDIVSMRDINDVHGYRLGDEFLVGLGYRLRAMAGEKGVSGRTGGDEFVLYLPLDIKDSEDEILQEIMAELSRPVSVGDSQVSGSVRCGYTRLGNEQRSVESLLREAELALYRNREDQGQIYRAYTRELSDQAQERILLTRELRMALEKGQFEIHYQPKNRLKDGKLLGGEALIRWNHPQRGLVSPGLFIPLAEKSQLIAPMGDWIVEDVCKQLSTWHELGLPDLPVAINLSLVQLRDPEFPERMLSTIRKFGLEPSLLTFEITETVFEQESVQLTEQLRKLHEGGIRLSLDDFGTGYSSLSYLHKYPFQEIKIDRAFVEKIQEPATEEIVRTILGLARALKAEVVAEGIETSEVRDRLISMGCLYGQGFFFGRPMPARDYQKLLRSAASAPE